MTQKDTSVPKTEASSKPSVLVVDDDKVELPLVSRHLEDSYAVTTAADGIEALLNLGRTNFDAILLDVNMPKLDGFTLLETIRQKNIDTPIVFLTGQASRVAVLRSVKLGVADYLIKPIKKELLLSRLKKILAR
ncbi:MAG: response regulator [Deltaproteobacteria bacterium]|nr:response regulator [Deltaproteobacteria bacterium]